MRRFSSPTPAHALRQQEAIEDPSLGRKIASIQQIVMSQNFDIHNELNRYSDMIEDQRRILYAERLSILLGEQPMSLRSSGYGYSISMNAGLTIWPSSPISAKAFTWRASPAAARSMNFIHRLPERSIRSRARSTVRKRRCWSGLEGPMIRLNGNGWD